MFPIPAVGGAPTARLPGAADDEEMFRDATHHALSRAETSMTTISPMRSTDDGGDLYGKDEAIPNSSCSFPWHVTRCLSEGIFPNPGKVFLASTTAPDGASRSTATRDATASATGNVHYVNKTIAHRLLSNTAVTHLTSLVTGMFIVIFMQAAGGSDGGSSQHPPTWGPEMEASYSFRDYSHDILLWVMQTTLQPHQQCAAIMQRLRGQARSLARMMSADEIARGGVVNGVNVDPVTLLFHGLQQRFGPLQEEARLSALNQFMNFGRKPNEGINELITRFETSHSRAVSEGGFQMSYEGLSFMLLKIVGPSDAQILQILQPTNNNFPVTQAEFYAMLHSLRRMGHILEHHPGNIASQMRSGHRESSRTHFTQASDDSPAYFAIPDNSTTPWANTDSNAPATLAFPAITDGTVANVSQADHIRSAYLGNAGGNVPAGGAGQDDELGMIEDPSDGATSTDTSSDDYEEPIPHDPALDAMTPQEAAEHIWWTHRMAKKRWRRFTSKTTRKVRRWTKRTKRTKGKGRGSRYFLDTEEGQEAYWASKVGHKMHRKGKSKGHGRKSSGKGFNLAYLTKRKQKQGGTRKNPKGPDGQIMKCSICGSEEHFRAECPRNSSTPSTTAHLAWAGLAQADDDADRSPQQTSPGSGGNVPEPASSGRDVGEGPMSQFLAEYGIQQGGNVPEPAGRQLHGAPSGSFYFTFAFMAEEQPTSDDGRTDSTPPPDLLEDAWNGQTLGEVDMPPGVAAEDFEDMGWHSYRPTNFARAAQAVRRAADLPPLPQRSTPISQLPSSNGPAGAMGMVNYLNSVRRPGFGPSLIPGTDLHRSATYGSAPPSEAATPSVRGNFPGVGTSGSSLVTAFAAAQQTSVPVSGIGTSNETAAVTQSALARANLSRLLDVPTQLSAPRAPPTDSIISMVVPRPYDPVGAISHAQAVRDDLRRQRREEAAVRIQNSVIQDPLRAGQVFPDGNRAPWQEDIPRYQVPWIQPLRQGDLAEPPREVPVIYEGDQRECSICTAEFREGERVCRLLCRHMFHTECWERHQIASRNQECPNCRGQGRLTAVWEFVAPPPDEEADAPPAPNLGEEALHQMEAPAVPEEEDDGPPPLDEAEESDGPPPLCESSDSDTDYGCYKDKNGRWVRRAPPPEDEESSAYDSDEGEGNVPETFRYETYAEVDDVSQYPAFGVHASGRQFQREGEAPHTETFEYLPEEHEKEIIVDCLVYVEKGKYAGRYGRVRSLHDQMATVALLGPGKEETTVPEEQVRLSKKNIAVRGNISEHGDVTRCWITAPSGPSLLVDPGSWGNLAGSDWMKEASRAAVEAGLGQQIKQTKRPKQLKVTGVGKGHEAATHDVHVPITLNSHDDRAVSGSFEAAVIENSQLPALLGLKTLIDQRAILDFTDANNLTLSFGGPGKTTIDYAPGTDVFQLEQAPTGHLMLPCALHTKRLEPKKVVTGYGIKPKTGEEEAVLALYRRWKECEHPPGLEPDEEESYAQLNKVFSKVKAEHGKSRGNVPEQTSASSSS